jgi:hypothetical protein
MIFSYKLNQNSGEYMKTILLSVLLIASTHKLMAATNCDTTATKAAKDFMAQQMDQACAKSSAKILKKSVKRNIIKYEIDVQCGPNLPSNHYSQEVDVNVQSCEVLKGGPGDA